MLVVTQYPEITALAKERGFETLQNWHPERGQSETIRLGTRALSDCDAICFMVADQPLLRRETLAREVDFFSSHRECIVALGHNGARGNPCLFPARFFPELLELREQRRDLVFESAAVIDRESTNWTSALTLNRGTAHGVEKNDCVVSAEGDLVGVVSAVGYNWCTVLTVIDTDTELGARVFRTQEVAVAEGDLALMGEGKLKLSYLSADAQLLSGDVVTTSGLGGFYPGGLVIGTVESVRTGDDGLAQYAVLAPAARLGELSEVFIIKDFDIVD